MDSDLEGLGSLEGSRARLANLVSMTVATLAAV